MEGTYRIHGEVGELFESFVAAPGPAGWRYFGRVFTAEADEELSTVDFVVDTDWRLVRYRERHRGAEVLVVPGRNGLEATWGDGGREVTVDVHDAEIVWSRSPCSLLVAERRARALGTNALIAVRVDMRNQPAQLVISLDRSGVEPARAVSGSPTAERIQVRQDGHAITALIREDLPVSADGWFDLLT